MQQLSLLDLMEPPAAVMIEPCDPYGQVLQVDPDETLLLPRKGWVDMARIELHRHIDGRWMWATGYSLPTGCGSSYKVGPKWGHFAASRADALRAAVDELIASISKRAADAITPKIISWARGLK